MIRTTKNNNLSNYNDQQQKLLEDTYTR